MKLNGKIYLRQETIINTLEDIVILLEMGQYYEISDAIRNIKPENAENVAVQIAKFQDMFMVYFQNENYCKVDTILEMTQENQYDPKKEKVSLYTQGAYGIKVASDKDATERYIFNVCLQVFMSKIKINYK